MFSAYYAAMLSMWSTLVNYARLGQLADGSPMPPAMKLEILTRAPVVNGLVTRGRSLSSTDLAGNVAVVEQLLTQQVALRALFDRFGILSVMSFITTPPIDAGRRLGAQLRETDPELANIINRNLPSGPSLGFELGLGGGLALALAGIVALKYLFK